MSDDNETPQIQVNDTPVLDQSWAALRQVAPPIMAFVLAKGWIDNDLAILLGVIAGIIYPIVAGQLKTRHRAKQLANIAASPKVPDSVAVLKSALES